MPCDEWMCRNPQSKGCSCKIGAVVSQVETVCGVVPKARAD